MYGAAAAADDDDDEIDVNCDVMKEREIGLIKLVVFRMNA